MGTGVGTGVSGLAVVSGVLGTAGCTAGIARRGNGVGSGGSQAMLGLGSGSGRAAGRGGDSQVYVIVLPRKSLPR